jgi:TonB family protein
LDWIWTNYKLLQFSNISHGFTFFSFYFWVTVQSIKHNLKMKKTLLSLIYLQFFVLQSFSQNTSDEYNSIQKFIESTVIIPFMARVADVQGTVNVRITMGIDGLPMKYEVVKNLRPDCDLEALRVAKLINLRNLKSQFQGKESFEIQVPFHNQEKIYFENGYILNYFDKNIKPTNKDDEVKFSRRYLVDSLSGIVKGNAEYFEYKTRGSKSIGFAVFMVDSSESNIPTFLENKVDSIKKCKYSSIGTGAFPKMYFETYKNGQVSFREIDKQSYFYYPNGRIKTVLEGIEIDSEKVVKEINWYANGQISSVSNFVKAQPNDPHKYMAVWDTLGKKIVENGEGLAEFYDKQGVEIGLFKRGFKDGIWIKKLSNELMDYKESYDMGSLLEGTRYAGRDSIKYDVVDIRASFMDGMRGFAKHLQKNLLFPADAQRSGAQGTVLVEFKVCTDGTLCDYAITQSVSKSLNQEAIRVVKLTSGKWKSGKSRGIPVSTKFTLPVTFQSLGVINR